MAEKKDILRSLPSVDHLLGTDWGKELLDRYHHDYVVEKVRESLHRLRQRVLAGDQRGESLVEAVRKDVHELVRWEGESKLRKVINATGTILHTNLGRAVLAQEAVEEVVQAAQEAVTLEYDLDRGERGDRDRVVEDDLVALTGAEAGTVVNNNAAAVLLALNTLAEGREVIVSRGELIEIGGSFRIPDVMRKSGAYLREVGTTNRTHRGDYEEAIGPATALFLKVHTSNYRIIGFTAAVNMEELVGLGKQHRIPVMEDLGSGALIDLSAWGLPKEPVVREQIGKGVDVVTFSGDKLLGGPQAGILVGKKEIILGIKKNPLKRALRPGKLTLAALSATLRLYRRAPRVAAVFPTLRCLSRSLVDMEAVGRQAIPLLTRRLGGGFAFALEDETSQVGSGALPEQELPTKVIAITHPAISAEKIAEMFRRARPPVLGRIKEGKFLLDLRGIFSPEELLPEFSHEGGSFLDLLLTQ